MLALVDVDKVRRRMVSMIKGKLESDKEITPTITIVGKSTTFKKDKGGKWVRKDSPEKDVIVENLEEAFYPEDEVIEKKSALENTHP